MRVSVVICTWNRCELLRSTLESMRSLVVPPDLEWEILVVNNNSTDATDEVIQAFEGLLPLRRVFESALGISKARTAGVVAANGQWIIFTDDDVRVTANWMTAYLEAVEGWPGARYFGGPISPLFTPDVPRWVKRNSTVLAGMLSLLDLGLVARNFKPGEFPYGPNMAIHREALKQAAFNDRVGRKGDEQLRGSERSLFMALERQGVEGVWVPAARVYHFIPRNRSSLSYLWKYYRGLGRTQVRLGYSDGPSSLLHLGVSGLRALSNLRRTPGDWAGHLAGVAFKSGQYSESRVART